MNTHKINTLIIDVSPSEVDAGAELRLKGKVSCSAPFDLRGQVLLIKDHDAAMVARIELTEFDGVANETSAFVVRAPVKPGAYSWLATFSADAEKGISRQELSSPFSFTVNPHRTTLLVWDVPSTITAGEKFSIKVGMKCSSECGVVDTEVGIFDHKASQVTTAMINGDIWPGSSALYFTEVELEAPAQESGYCTWEARVRESETEIPHAEATATFGIRLVPPPECLVTLEVFEADRRTPIKAANVVMHPYRTITDERGVAELRVPKGTYNVLVSASNHEPVSRTVEVTDDIITRTELALEPPQDTAWGY